MCSPPTSTRSPSTPPAASARLHPHVLAANKDKKPVNAARRSGAEIDTTKKYNAGTKKAASSGTSFNTNRLDEDNENLAWEGGLPAAQRLGLFTCFSPIRWRKYASISSSTNTRLEDPRFQKIPLDSCCLSVRCEGCHKSAGKSFRRFIVLKFTVVRCILLVCSFGTAAGVRSSTPCRPADLEPLPWQCKGWKVPRKSLYRGSTLVCGAATRKPTSLSRAMLSPPPTSVSSIFPPIVNGSSEVTVTTETLLTTETSTD